VSRWAAVLAGGSGTRFWPLSTGAKPKQMLSLSGDAPLLVQTADRLAGLVPPERVLIVTGKSLLTETRRLLPHIPPENVLAEPRAASTAPALAWATSVAQQQDAEAAVLSLHADWYVGDDAQFRKTAALALDVAERHDVLVTVGVKPTRPETGYGYIIPGDVLEGEARHVKEFIEKPDAQRAVQLVQSGALWNSGLFAWTARRFLDETLAVAHELAPHVEMLVGGEVEQFFTTVTPVAVDVSHFERSRHVACVPGRYPWDDVGTWAALGRVRREDESGNVLVGDVFQRGARGCVVWADHGTIVLDGVADLVVVNANGVTLVTTKAGAADLKQLLGDLPIKIRRLTE
jgi:mannose-1-phosphate guanylyltransferase